MPAGKGTVLVVAGTRPEAIKLAPVMWSLEKLGVDYTFVWSGQHYDYEMSKLLFEQLGIPEPSVDLGCGSGSHAEQTAKIMVELEKVAARLSPSILVAQGDTNTVVAAALTAAKLRVPFAHVEAGLRSWNMAMPEEINRKVADAIATLHFAPTRLAAINLLFEGARPSGIYVTGNTVVDTLYAFRERAAERGEELLAELDLEKRNYILVTVHRAENTDSPKRLTNIVEAIRELARHFKVVFPAHPRTREKLKELGLSRHLEGVTVTKPLGYLEFIGLLMHSKLVLSDSGGVQEEAFTLKIPTVVLRYNTERPETTMHGICVLAGAEKEAIVELAWRQIERAEEVRRLDFTNPLGDGHAGERIARTLKERLEEGLSVAEPDLRETPVVSYALLNASRIREQSEVLVAFDEEGRPLLPSEAGGLGACNFLVRRTLRYDDESATHP